ncbi:MAG: hypothetical protein CSA20_03980 [Deltaproteobacteria bacterium]|nr:MAG: hypothetical protein CSB23_01380 [Deltaproteobacteria bacterium]PIE73250.1 MAG: hypothetical protein CSA20_03980 [Deltaproteobacteria bacterium]
MSLLATQLGIKQKSLFDHLMEDAGSLQRIAREFEDFGERQTRVAKTYVISRKTLETLEQISLQYDTPRDALVEFSIERIVPLLLEEQQKHEKRKKLAAEVKQYLADGVALVHEAQKHLEEDDPTLSELLSMVRSVKNSSATIDRIIERCRQIEDF